MTMAGASGVSSLAVALNTPPACSAEPCFTTDVNSTVFPAYTFTGSVNGWVDSNGDALTYEFGQVAGSVYVARDRAGPSTSYIFKVCSASYHALHCVAPAVSVKGCICLHPSGDPPCTCLCYPWAAASDDADDDVAHAGL